MDRKNNLMVDSQKPEWDWLMVECALRTNEDGKKNVIWQLAPSIFLTNPTSSEADPNVKLFIDTQKSLNYSPELGWNWHKSWNLPNISVKLEIKDRTGEQLLSPKNLYAQLFAVKKNADTEINQKITLFDVGIRGENKMEMIDGHVYFSAMKFSSTTYNNQGHNFHLLIAIYIHESNAEKPKVLTAVISPEIFVDSRRSARDYQEKKFNSFVEPFTLDHIEKEFIKRENKSKIQQETLINNDTQGFYNYLTAPNIRHKVKHPLFLAIRFSSCVSIYFNQSLFTLKQNEKNEKQLLRDIIETLQKKLLKDNQGKAKQQIDKSSINQKLFLFVVQNLNDSLKRKKIMEALESLQSPSLLVLEEKKDIPSNFTDINKLGNLVESYKQIYDSLKQMCKKYLPFDASSSDEQSMEEPQKANKKMKMNKFEGGVSSCNTRKRRQANIVCNAIPAKDMPKLSSEVQGGNSPSEQQKEAVKKEREQPEINQEPKELPSKHQIQGNAFSLSLGKGSAFNNIKPTEEQPQRQQNSNEGFSLFTGTNAIQGQNLGLSNNGMNFNSLGMNNSFLGGMGMGGLTNTGLSNLNNLNGLGVPPVGNFMGMNFPGLSGNLGNISNFNLFGQNNAESEQQNVLNSLLCNNLLLTNCLNSMKNNNRSSFDGVNGQTSPIDESNLKERASELLNQNLAQNQQQSTSYLLQQINIYRQLLSQITYQNELLGRNLHQNHTDPQLLSKQNNQGNIFGSQFDMNSYFMNNQLKNKQQKPKEQPK